MSGPRILIYLDMRRRDYLGGVYLREEFLKLGCEVKFASRYTIRTLFPAFQPDVVITGHTWILGKERLKEWARDTHLVVVPAEGAVVEDRSLCISDVEDGSFHPGIRNSTNTSFVSLYCTWGKRVRDWLVEDQVFDPKTLRVTGCPRFDGRMKNPAEKRKGFPVGILGQFDHISIFDNRNLFARIDNQRKVHGNYYSEGKNVEDRFWRNIAHLRLVYDSLDHFQKHEIDSLIRPHPNENPRDYDHMLNKYAPRLKMHTVPNLYDFMSSVSCVLILNTTTTIDALINNTPVITLEELLHGRMHDHVDYPESRKKYLDYLWRPKSFDELQDMIEKAQRAELPLVPMKEEMDTFLREVYTLPSAETASKKIAREVTELCKRDPKNKKRKFRPFAYLKYFAVVIIRSLQSMLPGSNISLDYHLLIRNKELEQEFLQNYVGND